MDVSLPAVSRSVEDYRQGGGWRPQITPGKIEDAAGDDEQPQNIHHAYAPHHGPEIFTINA